MPIRRADKDTQAGPGQLPWAALLLVRVLPDRVYALMPTADVFSAMPVGYVLMLKENVGASAPSRLLWGFRESFDKTPVHTALCVVEQNLGIKVIEQSRIRLVDRLLGGLPESHWKYLYCADISESERDRIDFRHRHATLRPFPVTTKDFYGRLAQGNLYEPHRVWLETSNLVSEEEFRMTG